MHLRHVHILWHLIKNNEILLKYSAIRWNTVERPGHGKKYLYDESVADKEVWGGRAGNPHPYISADPSGVMKACEAICSF